jgi:hypothetical protein
MGSEQSGRIFRANSRITDGACMLWVMNVGIMVGLEDVEGVR